MAPTSGPTPPGPSPGGAGGDYLLTGHKWFCSAPMSDAFLMLAQAPGGLSCFLAPRWRPDGTRNPIRIQRLKDKLGDRSNASSEIELAGTWARCRRGGTGRAHHHRDGQPHPPRLRPRLGRDHAPGRGPGHLAHHPPGAPSVRRSSTSRSWRTCWPTWRSSPRPPPLAALRLARAFDAGERRRARAAACASLTPVVKYWTCKRAPLHAAEALECLGGDGFVEESGCPASSGRARSTACGRARATSSASTCCAPSAREPASLDAYWSEVALAAGGDRRLDQAVDELHVDLADPDDARAAGPLGRRAAGPGVPGLPARPARPRRGRRRILRLAPRRGGPFGTLRAGVDTDVPSSPATPPLSAGHGPLAQPGSRARRTAAHMARTGGSSPVQASCWAAAWCTSMPRPPTVARPAGRAASSHGVTRGW